MARGIHTSIPLRSLSMLFVVTAPAILAPLSRMVVMPAGRMGESEESLRARAPETEPELSR
jgi:hypothetical protein